MEEEGGAEGGDKNKLFSFVSAVKLLFPVWGFEEVASLSLKGSKIIKVIGKTKKNDSVICLFLGC